MKKLTSALIIAGLFVAGCAAEDPLERGEKVLDQGRESFSEPVDKPEPGAPGEIPTPALNRKTYEDTILPIVTSCDACHDNYVDTYEKAVTYVVFGKPNESVFYQRVVLGQDGHKIKWKVGSDNERLLKNWINGL